MNVLVDHTGNMFRQFHPAFPISQLGKGYEGWSQRGGGSNQSALYRVFRFAGIDIPSLSVEYETNIPPCQYFHICNTGCFCVLDKIQVSFDNRSVLKRIAHHIVWFSRALVFVEACGDSTEKQKSFGESR